MKWHCPSLHCSKKIIESNSLLYSLIQLTKFYYSSRPIFTVAFPWMFLFAETKKRIQILNRSPWKLFSCCRGWTTGCVAGGPSLPYYWITLPWPTDMTNVLWLCRRAVALPCDAAAHQLHHQPMAENRKNRVWNSVRCQWWICFSTISIFLFFSLLFLFHYTLVMRARVLWSYPWYRVCSH